MHIPRDPFYCLGEYVIIQLTEEEGYIYNMSYYANKDEFYYIYQIEGLNGWYREDEIRKVHRKADKTFEQLVQEIRDL